MANSGWTADPDSITLPPGAADGDVYIYIGPDDPIAEALTQLAALVFYWNVDSAFLLTVERSFVGTTGGLHLYGTDPYHPLVQYIDIYSEGFPAGKSYLDLGTTVDTVGLLSAGDLRIESGGDFDKNQDQKTLSIQFIEDDGATDPDTELYGRSMARGLRGRASSTVSSAAIGTTETVVLTIAARDWRANRAYQITVSGRAFLSVATNVAIWGVRKTNAAGQSLCAFDRWGVTTTNSEVLSLHGPCFTVGAADVNAAIALTVRASAGTVTMFANTDNVRKIEIRDVGAASEYADEPVLV